MIDRKELLERNNPRLTAWEAESPLTVGNGELAFTADITGLQTFYEEQKEVFVPLCTMSQWGWHSAPAGENRDRWYRPEDVRKTPYESVKGTRYYASEVQPGNEEIYHWLRENPHRLNLARVGFLWEGKAIHPDQISDAGQVLELYGGILRSHFTIDGCPVETETVCAGKGDVLGFSIHSRALGDGRLTVLLAFPYGSRDITASDWEHDLWHETGVEVQEENQKTQMRFFRTLDRDSYQARLTCETRVLVTQIQKHAWNVAAKGEELTFTLAFAPGEEPAVLDFAGTVSESRERWAHFWDTCGVMDLHESEDPRAAELERRIVLSQYLLALQSLGSVPPQETGLTCNSWYGKFHLEMYPWHCAWAPLWNKPGMLKGSLNWYKEHLPQARANAACNGYRGARWPKMVDADGIDSPSSIATLLIWQQPHILWMLSLVYAQTKEDSLLEDFWEVIQETARFMCDFTAYDPQKGCYDLPAPLIPAQEEHDPRTTKNPTYELEYWGFALETAADWADHLGKDSENWREIAGHMAPPPQKDGLYLACETCPETFTRFNKDHPSMTAAFGLLPGKRIEPDKMRATLKKVLECWDYTTMWGWDFAMLAMTAVRLGDPETAIEILLKDTPKNSYVTSGNNYQRMRTDLPLYLPGNGSLLLAAAMMAAGYEGCEETFPGFPKNGKWKVMFENIAPFPY
ncbi:MAG: glycoside hydrolase family 65 [Candidatus Limivivens sp.]|nr:glycoside hydrolase family 65 [Candidatus Limivivens sp.]